MARGVPYASACILATNWPSVMPMRRSPGRACHPRATLSTTGDIRSRRRITDHANNEVQDDAPRPDHCVAISSSVRAAPVGSAEPSGNAIGHRRTTAVSTSWAHSSSAATSFAPTGLALHNVDAEPSVFAPCAFAPSVFGCSPRIHVLDAVSAPRCYEFSELPQSSPSQQRFPRSQ
jgi:hypothetical protein